MIFPFILNDISVSVLLFELDEHERGMCNNNNSELTMVESKSLTIIAPTDDTTHTNLPRYSYCRRHGNVIGKLQLPAMKKVHKLRTNATTKNFILGSGVVL